jgi:tRNA(Ile)-lysidine synthase
MNKHKQTLWVAFSGGMDSQVLLHFLSIHFSNLHLKAIHINHQLIPESIQWEKHCRKICRNLNIALKIIRVNIIKKSGESLEAKARDTRYDAFKKLLKQNDILITAHHQDDQAETFLYQLLRGAGLRGVSAMPQVSVLDKGFLLRPLLNFSRNDLKKYAIYHKLNWIEDPSNQNTSFDRNYLRQSVFPLLKKRWPGTDKTFSRFAKHCAEQEKLLTILAEKDYQDCHGEYLNSIFIPKLILLNKTRQKNILRYFIEKLNFNLPSEKTLIEILKICTAKKDKNPIVSWTDTEFRRYQNHLFILSPIKQRSDKLSDEEKMWCKKNLNFNINSKNIFIQYRQGGEKFKAQHSKHTRTLKNLYQEWKIPVWLRDKIPLIYYDKKLVAIIGYAALHL